MPTALDWQKIKVIEIRVDEDGWAQEWVSTDGSPSTPVGTPRHECSRLYADARASERDARWRCPTCGQHLLVKSGVWYPAWSLVPGAGWRTRRLRGGRR